MRATVLAMSLVFGAVACGSSKSPQASKATEASVSDGSEGSEFPPPRQALEIARPPLEIAPPPPREPDAQALERAAQDCDKACRYVTKCVPGVALQQCTARCQQSLWVASNATRCLALRILWIDEEGCPRIAPTWQLFDDADDCSGPAPDER